MYRPLHAADLRANFCGPMLAFLFLITAAIPNPAVAQTHGWTVEAVPSVGWYSPTQPLGSGDLDGDAGLLGLSGSPSAGLALIVRPPTAFLALRFGGLYSRPDLNVQTHAGLTSCGTDCFRANQKQSTVGQSSIAVVTADVLFSMPRVGSASPFAAVGAGIKRYHLDANPGTAPSTFADATYTDATGHLALGVNLDAGRFRVTAEAGDYVSKFRERGVARAEGSEAGFESPGQWQHDIALTVGVAVRVR